MKRLGLVLMVCLVAMPLSALAASAKRQGQSQSNGMSLEQTLQAEGRFTTYLALRQLAHLNQGHPANGPSTFLAPNDAAFAALPAGELDRLKSDPARLRKFFDTYTLAGRVTAADMVGPGRSQSHHFKSTGGASLEFSPAPAAPVAPTATGAVGPIGPAAPAPAAPTPAAPEAPTANTAAIGPVGPIGPVAPEQPTQVASPSKPVETAGTTMPADLPDAPLASPAMVPIDPITVQAVKDALTKMQTAMDASLKTTTASATTQTVPTNLTSDAVAKAMAEAGSSNLKTTTVPSTDQTAQMAQMESDAAAQAAAEATKLKMTSALMNIQSAQIISTQPALINGSTVFEMSGLLSTVGL
jgi:hypothetical protein